MNKDCMIVRDSRFLIPRYSLDIYNAQDNQSYCIMQTNSLETIVTQVIGLAYQNNTFSVAIPTTLKGVLIEMIQEEEQRAFAQNKIEIQEIET